MIITEGAIHGYVLGWIERIIVCKTVVVTSRFVVSSPPSPSPPSFGFRLRHSYSSAQLSSAQLDSIRFIKFVVDCCICSCKGILASPPLEFLFATFIYFIYALKLIKALGFNSIRDWSLESTLIIVNHGLLPLTPNSNNTFEYYYNNTR